MTQQLRAVETPTYCVNPREVRFTEEGLSVAGDSGDEQPVACIDFLNCSTLTIFRNRN